MFIEKSYQHFLSSVGATYITTIHISPRWSLYLWVRCFYKHSAPLGLYTFAKIDPFS